MDDDKTLDRGRDFARDATASTGLTSDAGIETMPDSDHEVDAIVVEIEATRAEMTETVDELGDRLDPGNVAARAGEAVREATIGKLETKVNDMSSSASDFASTAGQTAQDAGTGIMETIRQNPVPAAMAAIGIGWLWKSRASGGSSGSQRWTSDGSNRADTRWASDARWRSQSGSDFADRAGNVGDAMGRRVDDTKEAVGNAAASARRTADETLDTFGERAGTAANSVAGTANDALSTAQQAVESNPLAFGAIAVAVGAAIGLALPATPAEKRIMGPAGGQLIDRVETAVSEPLEKMQSQTAG